MASAPPEIKANSKSGTLLATLKASSSRERPNWRAINTWRKMASNLSVKKKTANNSDIFDKRDNFMDSPELDSLPSFS